jgi:diguanylate cyclase (GGDEF)-like protein
MNDIHVLFVDDEADILSAIKRMMCRENYAVHFAGSGADALDIMAGTPIHIVVSDMRMPEMDGLTLLRQVKERYPDTVRMALSANIQVSHLLHCINTGEIFRYITKPTKPDELRHALRDALEYFLVRKDRITLVHELQEKNEKLQQSLKALEEANRKLENLSNIDCLTGVFNRRHFNERLTFEYERLSRSRGELSLILMDIDHFKDYNDCYGHIAGDECLTRVAKALQSGISRSSDFCARYGGEEFVCILPETDKNGGYLIAEKIRSSIESLCIEHRKSNASQYVTISLGVATIQYSSNETAIDCVHKADMALYQSKKFGRNRVTHFSADMEP